MADIKTKKVSEKADVGGSRPYDQVKTGGQQDVSPRSRRAENSVGDPSVKTPWVNSHQVVKGSEPYWQTHHKNSQGLNGQTDWQHKGAKRGNTSGPQQGENPWTGINTDKTNDLDQTM